MPENIHQDGLEDVVLQLDNGVRLSFLGRQFAGGSWYDEETNVLTRQNLYVTDSGEHIYSITSGDGQKKSRRAYRVVLHGEQCTIHDGRTEITLELEMLMLAVKALTGIEKSEAPSLEMIEEILRAANA